MELLIVLLLGAGAVLIASAIETDPATGNNVSILQTIGDIWNDRIDFTQPSTAGGTGNPNMGKPCHGIPDPARPLYDKCGDPLPINVAAAPLTTPTFVGGASGDAYRSSVVRSWLASKQAGTL